MALSFFVALSLGGCAEPESDSMGLSVEAIAGSRLFRVRWTTPSDADGVIEFGVGAPDQELVLEGVGRDHRGTVALPSGDGVVVQVRSTDGETTWLSEPTTVDVEFAPATLPRLTVAGSGHDRGFLVVPVVTQSSMAVTLMDDDDQFAWWREGIGLGTFRALWDGDASTISWVDTNMATRESTIVVSTLDHDETTVGALPELHHDFESLPGGGWLAIAYDERTVDGETIRGDQVVEISADGSSQRVVWSSWDHLEYAGGAMQGAFGLEWPHCNSLSYDPSTGKIWLSAYLIDSILQIDRETGEQDWQLGGVGSDWQVEGEPFGGQHAPVSIDGGRGMLLMDNGVAFSGKAGRAVRYALDAETHIATPTLVYDGSGTHTDTELGNFIAQKDGSYLVAWGSAGRLEEVDAAGERDWQLDSQLGYAVGFVESLGMIPEPPG